MATSAARNSSTFVRSLWRNSATTTTRISPPPRRPNASFLRFQQPRLSPPPHSPLRFRRELNSLFPIHSATASACLVSKLPSEVSTSTEGRFANYLSPI